MLIITPLRNLNSKLCGGVCLMLDSSTLVRAQVVGGGLWAEVPVKQRMLALGGGHSLLYCVPATPGRSLGVSTQSLVGLCP